MLLNFFYQNKIGKFFRKIITTHLISNICGWASNRRFSRYFIKSFIAKNKIDMNDFIVPADGYKSFNDFFYRKLKPGKRSIDSNENSVISPADCKVFAIPELNSGSTFFVKNCKFGLDQFLKNENLAKAYENGTLLLFRLAPPDYHRFHFPFDCTPSQARVINGKLESVNPIVYKSGIQPLIENERHLITLKSENFGPVLFIPVGAMFVGKINETYLSETFYKKGSEIGYFAFGGSSIVMLFKKDVISITDTILQNSQNNIETKIHMGKVIGIRQL